MHVDELIPRPDIDKRHSALISAPPERSWHAIERLDLRDSWTIRWLFRLRGLPSTSVTWDSLMRLGFTELIVDAPRETVLGLVAQPWRPRGGIRRVAPEDFTEFNEPGYVKIAWSFAVATAATAWSAAGLTVFAGSPGFCLSAPLRFRYTTARSARRHRLSALPRLARGASRVHRLVLRNYKP